MKINLLLFLVLLLLMGMGCLSKKDRDVNKMGDDWNALTIVSENSTVITINNYNDTTLVKMISGGGFFMPKPEKIKIDSLKVYFTKAEKDSVFYLVKNIIQQPVTSKRRCTDFVGELKLVIDYGSARQQINYTGVCDWSLLSDDTKQLHEILKRKMKDNF